MNPASSLDILSSQIGSYPLLASQGLVCLRPATPGVGIHSQSLQELETRTGDRLGYRPHDKHPGWHVPRALFTQSVTSDNDSIYSIEYTSAHDPALQGYDLSAIWCGDEAPPRLARLESGIVWPPSLKEDTIRVLTTLSGPLDNDVGTAPIHGTDIAGTYVLVGFDHDSDAFSRDQGRRRRFHAPRAV